MAIIVAIEDYDHVLDVPGATKNARSWLTYLHKMRGVPLSNIAYINDKFATKESVEMILADYVLRTSKGGIMWFIFIGHGAPSKDSDDGVLVGADTREAANSLYARSISRRVVLEELRRGAQDHTVVVLDTCFSGRTTQGTALVTGLQPLIPVDIGQKARATTIFSATTQDQFAGPLPGENRPAFSYLLLGALRGWGDKNKDNRVTAQEARDYTEEVLSFLLKGSRTQTPQMFSSDPNLILSTGKKFEISPDIFDINNKIYEKSNLNNNESDYFRKVNKEKKIVSFVSSPAGAVVTLNGVAICQKTPCKREIEIGEHFISVGGDCFKPNIFKLNIVEDDKNNKEFLVSLDTIKTEINISAVDDNGDALDAEIYVEKQKVGMTPDVLVLSICEDNIEIKKNGYMSQKIDLWVRDEKSNKLVVNLKKEKNNELDLNAMIFIKGGEFLRGSEDGSPGEKPVKIVNIDDFYIDAYEVTVEKYDKCVKSGVCSEPKSGGFCNWLMVDRKNHPVNCVNWFQANDYCRWVGKRLPTEAEWEKAARGTNGLMYPWGNVIGNCDYAVLNDGVSGCGKNATWVVGSRPQGRSPYGVYDMGGNVWEWVYDWYDSNYYSVSPLTNPEGPKKGSNRTFKGGSWFDNISVLRSSNRFFGVPQYSHSDIGFRCAN